MLFCSSSICRFHKPEKTGKRRRGRRFLLAILGDFRPCIVPRLSVGRLPFKNGWKTGKSVRVHNADYRLFVSDENRPAAFLVPRATTGSVGLALRTRACMTYAFMAVGCRGRWRPLVGLGTGKGFGRAHQARVGAGNPYGLGHGRPAPTGAAPARRQWPSRPRARWHLSALKALTTGCGEQPTGGCPSPCAGSASGPVQRSVRRGAASPSPGGRSCEAGRGKGR